MDLERIKQNFRIRSGRSTKKPRKNNKSNGAPVPPKNTAQKSDQLSNGTASTPAPKSSPASKEPETNTPEKNTESQSGPSPASNKTQDGTSEEHQGQKSGDLDASNPSSRRGSIDSQGSSLALQTPSKPHQMADQEIPSNATSSDAEDFDLSPPKPRSKPPSVETLSELLFSSGHLDAILQHPPQLARFSAFLQKYSPQHYPLLMQYLETRKAVKAIEYANAIAEGLKPTDTGKDESTDTISVAAKLDSKFEAICNASFDALVGDALCSYVSYSLVKVASECMTNEITGRSTPMMRDLVDGLSEVFCLTDPNQEDNPIIYASEEFYRLTRYGPDDVLNNNCRFLQGRKTNPLSPKRLKNAIQSGEEISETLLNYRRDGRPFINLLMIAPLHDKNGKVKYHIGAQIDVSGLVQGGRTLEGFQRYLARRGEEKRRKEAEKADDELDDDQRRKKRALARLRDLSETFDLEETAVVQAVSRSNSRNRDNDDNASVASVERQKAPRRVYNESDSSDYGDEDGAEEKKKDDADWKLGDAGDGRLSGKLPGVYDSFILFRPAPSFRIVFVSPKLRKLGDAQQAPFLSHVAAPNGTLNGLVESLKAGVPVSAKVHFMPERGERRDGTRLKSGSRHEDGKNGRAIWISCTPLLGADDRIGVWMCVIVEKSKVGSIIRKRESESAAAAEGSVKGGDSKESAKGDQSEKAEATVSLNEMKSTIESLQNGTKREDLPIKPVRIDSDTVIKPQVEKSPESAEAGQDQTSKTVRPQQSIYFDAEQGADVDTKEASKRRDPSEPASSGEDTVNGNRSPKPASIRERDPRAVVTPVQEYEETGRNKKSYSVEIPGITDSEYHDESADEYITTRSPVTPSRQANSRILIEEDSDNLQDSDVDHQRDNLRVGRRRNRSSSAASLNSPASDIPPSVPSSAIIADDGEDDSDDEHDRKSQQDKAEAENLGETVEKDAGVSGDEDKDKPEEESKGEDKTGGQEEDEDKTEEDTKDKIEDKVLDNEEEVDADLKTPTKARHDRSSTPPDTKNEENDDNLDKSYATIKPTKDTSPARNSDRDSAISLDSPAQLKAKARSKSRSRSSHSDTASQKSHYDDEEKESKTPRYNEDLNDPNELDLQTRERDIETWVKEGRPPTSRNNSDNKTKSTPVHAHDQDRDQTPVHTGHSAPGIRLDYLGAGNKPWTRASRPRRRLDTDFGDYEAVISGWENEDEDDSVTRSDHCATSPYSVD